MRHLRLSVNLKILNKNIIFVTNSFFLKKIIAQGFACSLSKNKRKNSLMVTCFLKDTPDIGKIISSILNFVANILKNARGRYWIFHASAFSFNGHATIVLGDPGSGKSSLCLAAGLLGAKIISDEPVLIDRESHSVIPFRYIIKIDNFSRNFSQWSFPYWFDINRNRYIKQMEFEKIDFNLFSKEDINKLGIEVETRKIPLEKIIFLEQKRYDSLIHLSMHCLNKVQNLRNHLKSLSNLISGKKIKFLPSINKQLNDEKKTKGILTKIMCI